jgi:hypothetical protein
MGLRSVRENQIKLKQTKRKRASYLAFFAFSALNFAHRAFVAFEILARAAGDIVVLFRVAPLEVTIVAPECEPFNAEIAICIPLS